MSARTANRASKVCCTCRLMKPLSEFSRDRGRPDGRGGRCSLCNRSHCNERYHANPKPCNERAKRWRQANPQRARQLPKEWAKRNPERRRVIANRHASKKYYANLEESRRKGREAAKRRWLLDRESMTLLAKHCRAVRRARLRGAAVGRVSYRRILKRDGLRCHICKRAVKMADLHFDHVIPLAKGGSHTENNIAVSHAKCNFTKHAKVLTLF